MIAVYLGSSVTDSVSGEIAADIDMRRLCKGGQNSRGQAIVYPGMPCPPEQFIPIRGVVAAVLLGTPRHLGEGRSFGHLLGGLAGE